jgi:nucleotide sugar dehydrogenase
MQKKGRKAVVVGIGYVGLPLAVLAQEKGWSVTGLDIDEEKVRQVNAGECPLRDDEELIEQFTRYPITATTDPAVAKDAKVIIIAVPTPITDNNLPDLTPLISAVENLLPYLHQDQALIIESTINPGVTDEVIIPLLQKRADLPLDAITTKQPALAIVHCPERINPGDTRWNVRNVRRVIGGYSEKGVAKALSFYHSVIEAEIKPMHSLREAEAVKILENTFRDINIAFINEMAQSFAKLDIDISHVIEGAATKPFAFLPHYPSCGVGGHCISVDPYYMIDRARRAGFDHKFLRLARHINNTMPHYTVELLEKGLQEQGLEIKNVKVSLMGLAYKKGIADIRNSPALVIRDELKKKAADVAIFDPFLPRLSTAESVHGALQGAVAVVIATDHPAIVKELTAENLVREGIKLVIDGRNSLNADAIASQGIAYYGIGKSRQPLRR